MTDSKVLEAAVKPPMGVVPEAIWKSLREVALTQAVYRYVEAKIDVPEEWDKEIAKLLAERESKLIRVYLYRSWDGSFYLTRSYDGLEGLKAYICGGTTADEIVKIADQRTAVRVFNKIAGQESDIELYDFGVNLERS